LRGIAHAGHRVSSREISSSHVGHEYRNFDPDTFLAGEGRLWEELKEGEALAARGVKVDEEKPLAEVAVELAGEERLMLFTLELATIEIDVEAGVVVRDRDDDGVDVDSEVDDEAGEGDGEGAGVEEDMAASRSFCRWRSMTRPMHSSRHKLKARYLT